MSCDVGEVTKRLENHFTYVTTHSPTLPSLYLRHSSFSNPSVASPTSQLILQPFFRFSNVTGSSPGEPPMNRSINLSQNIGLFHVCVSDGVPHKLRIYFEQTTVLYLYPTNQSTAWGQAYLQRNEGKSPSLSGASSPQSLQKKNLFWRGNELLCKQQDSTKCSGIRGHV